MMGRSVATSRTMNQVWSLEVSKCLSELVEALRYHFTLVVIFLCIFFLLF